MREIAITFLSLEGHILFGKDQCISQKYITLLLFSQLEVISGLQNENFQISGNIHVCDNIKNICGRYEPLMLSFTFLLLCFPLFGQS